MYYKLLLPALVAVFSIHNNSYQGIWSKVKARTSSVQMSNINCGIQCAGQGFYCDTIAVTNDGGYSQTLELPLKNLAKEDAIKLITNLTNPETYTYSHKHGKVTDVIADCNCAFDPTIAILFRNKDSVIFAQVMMDMTAREYVIYYREHKVFTPGIDENGSEVVSFYNWSKSDLLLLMMKKYKLNCLELQHK